MDEELKELLERIDATRDKLAPLQKQQVEIMQGMAKDLAEAYKTGLTLLTGVKVLDKVLVATVECNNNPRKVLAELDKVLNSDELNYTVTDITYDPVHFKVHIFAKPK